MAKIKFHGKVPDTCTVKVGWRAEEHWQYLSC